MTWQPTMSRQLSDLAFFHLLCACHSTPDERVGDRYEPGDLVDQIDRHACVWSQCGNEIANLRLVIPEHSFGSTNSFNIAGTLRRSNLNGSGSSGWIAEVEVDNTQILALKMICLHYSLPGRLRMQRTRRLLRFRAEKREVVHLLSLFDSQEDLDCYLQPVALGKFPFVTQMESGV